jgi:hypothetical protein
MGPYFQKAQYNPWSEPVPTAGSGALVEGVVVVLPNLQDKSVSKFTSIAGKSVSRAQTMVYVSFD